MCIDDGLDDDVVLNELLGMKAVRLFYKLLEALVLTFGRVHHHHSCGKSCFAQ